eukprot:4457142-Prymnesium_polylepis.1
MILLPFATVAVAPLFTRIAPPLKRAVALTMCVLSVMVSVELAVTDANPPCPAAAASATRLPAILMKDWSIRSAPPSYPALVFEISEPGSIITLLPAKAITAPPFQAQLVFKIEL